MSEQKTAMFLITATGKRNSLSVAVASATEALAKVRELESEGFSTVVFDTAGRERPITELQEGAKDEARQAG